MKPYLKTWPLWGALALALAAALCLASITPRTFAAWQSQRAFPFQLDAEEGFILNQAVTLAGGGPIYRSIAHPPFLVGNYPPLLPWVFSLVTGPRATFESLPAGRVLIEIAALLAALGLGAIAALRTRRAVPALLAALLFFATYEVNHWSAFVRVDFPALLLTVAGLGVFLGVRGRRGLVGSAVIFVAAGFTRQTALVAPAACAAALLVNDRRRLAWFLAPYAGLGLAVLGVLEWRTGGEFYRHVVIYNRNQMDWSGFARLMKNEVWFFFKWWLAALGWAIGWRFFFHYHSAFGHSDKPQAAIAPVGEAGEDARAPRENAIEVPHARYVLTFYFALGSLSILSYAKVGAAPNYVLEPLAAAALWSAETLGLMLGWLAEFNGDFPDFGVRRLDAAFERRGLTRRAAARWAAIGSAWVFTALLLAHGAHMRSLAGRFPWSAAPQLVDRAAGGELLRLVREAPGDVYCEDPVYSLLAGKAVLHQPFIMAQLAKEGRWNPQPMLDWLKAKKFSLFVATENLSPGAAKDYERYIPAMAGELAKHYTPVGTLPLPGVGKQYIIWKPR